MTLSQGENDPLGIGKKVKLFRNQFTPKLTQAELGELAFGKGNGSQPFIKRIEQGEQEPRPSQLVAIAFVLTVRIEDFFRDSIDPRVIERLQYSRPRPYPPHVTP